MQVVSWGELIIGFVVLGIMWYGYVGLRYYRRAIKELGKGKQWSAAQVKWTREPEANHSHTTGGLLIAQKNYTHAQVHELMQGLKLVFAAAVRDQLSKEQILEAIKIRLAKYTSLPSEIRASIAQHIVHEFSLQLQMNVTVEEMNALW